jgi:hypothetical protein
MLYCFRFYNTIYQLPIKKNSKLILGKTDEFFYQKYLTIYCKTTWSSYFLELIFRFHDVNFEPTSKIKILYALLLVLVSFERYFYEI